MASVISNIGRVPEWLNGPDLKSGGLLCGLEGSNPSPSAMAAKEHRNILNALEAIYQANPNIVKQTIKNIRKDNQKFILIDLRSNIIEQIAELSDDNTLSLSDLSCLLEALKTGNDIPHSADSKEAKQVVYLDENIEKRIKGFEEQSWLFYRFAITPYKYRELFVNIEIPRPILLVGKSGTGKSKFAKIVSKEEEPVKYINNPGAHGAYWNSFNAFVEKLKHIVIIDNANQFFVGKNHDGFSQSLYAGIMSLIDKEDVVPVFIVKDNDINMMMEINTMFPDAITIDFNIMTQNDIVDILSQVTINMPLEFAHMVSEDLMKMNLTRKDIANIANNYNMFLYNQCHKIADVIKMKEGEFNADLFMKIMKQYLR